MSFEKRPVVSFQVRIFMKNITKALFFVFWLFLLGCQTIKYHAEPTPLITLEKQQSKPENFSHSFDVDFYWFGASPKVAKVNLTQIAQQYGAPHGLSNLRIREEQTFWNFICGFFTLGIYTPRGVEIYGVKVEKESFFGWGGF